MRLPPLTPGVLLRRHQRFLAEVRLESGESVTAHTANTGRMSGVAEPGSRVWLSRASNPRRKLPWTWELVEVEGGVLVGINTLRANTLVAEAVDAGVIAELRGYPRIRREVPYAGRHRIDLLLEGEGRPPCYVEVKNTTLVEAGVARFPDAVSTRATRHLHALAQMVAQGARAVVVFCVQRGDAETFAPADAIDAVYGQALREVAAEGVEFIAYRAQVSTEAVCLDQALPVVL